MQVQRSPSIEGWLGTIDERLANQERLPSMLMAPGKETALIDFGTIELTLTAAEAATKTIPHSLGVTPKAVLLSGAGTSLGAVFYWESTSLAEASFLAVLRHTGNTTATVKANWIAIG